MQAQNKITTTAGFSFIELLIAMTITLVALMIAVTILASGFNNRSRENQRSDAITDAQRAINIMSREIANSGFGLDTNGIVAADTGISSIRVRANLNAYGGNGFRDEASDRNEDIKFYVYTSGESKIIARYDRNTGTAAPLANRIDSLKLRYYPAKVDYVASNCDITTEASEVAPISANYIVLSACVQLPQVGAPGGSGFQPASTVHLTTNITLRNFNQAKINEY